MKPYVVRISLDATRTIEVGVEADTSTAAESMVADRFISGVLFDGESDVMVLSDRFSEDGEAPGYQVYEHPWDRAKRGGDSSLEGHTVELGNQPDYAREAARLLVLAYQRAEHDGGSVEWEDVDEAYSAALKAVESQV